MYLSMICMIPVGGGGNILRLRNSDLVGGGVYARLKVEEVRETSQGR